MIYLPFCFCFLYGFILPLYIEGVGTYWKEEYKEAVGSMFWLDDSLNRGDTACDLSLVFVFFSLSVPETLQEYNSMVEGAGITQYSFLWAVSTLLLPPLTEEIIFEV